LTKTKQQLEGCFYEKTFNENNLRNPIDFSKKIIVFEDIDCVGDIVLKRENKLCASPSEVSDVSEDKMMSSLFAGVAKEISKTEEPVTLDDILNLWDGIRETPGRILIISSNHYDKLDSALVRPGRIDITHEFSNASRATIAELHMHLFQTEIDAAKLEQIKENHFSPAELVNLYVSTMTEDKFVDRLING
jgi:chaperone BCS1